MIKYLKQQKWKEANKNDLDFYQFYLEKVEYGRSATSTLNRVRLDRIESYLLFLKTVEAETLSKDLESVINNAKADGVDVIEESITVERQENGYLINLIFTIRN